MASQKKDDSTKTTEIEIRKSRRFNLADAIGRAGAGNLKGASPIPRSQQVLMDLEESLAAGLYDPPGSLAAVLMARLKQNLPLIDKHLDDPTGALREMIQQLLRSESLLLALARETDVRWGRDYQERPFFHRPGQPADPEDPYTPTGIRETLQDFLDRL